MDFSPIQMPLASNDKLNEPQPNPKPQTKNHQLDCNSFQLAGGHTGTSHAINQTITSHPPPFFFVFHFHCNSTLCNGDRYLSDKHSSWEDTVLPTSAIINKTTIPSWKHSVFIDYLVATGWNTKHGHRNHVQPKQIKAIPHSSWTNQRHKQITKKFSAPPPQKQPDKNQSNGDSTRDSHLDSSYDLYPLSFPLSLSLSALNIRLRSGQ